MRYVTTHCIANREVPLQLGDVGFYNFGNPTSLPASVLSEDVSPRARRHLEELHWTDPFAISLANPFLERGVAFGIHADGFAKRIYGVFDPEYRLHHVRQLARLQDPFLPEDVLLMSDSGSQLLRHTRFAHSLDVYVVTRLLAFNMRLPRISRLTALAAALTHDVGTPGGGDATKAVLPRLLSEELNYASLIGPRAKAALCKYGIPEQGLVNAVRNKGLAGIVLDIADRIAYVARDAVEFAHLDLEQKSQVCKLILQYPQVFQAWEDFRREGDIIYSINPRRFERLSRIRAHLFVELYLHPRARSREQTLMQAMIERLLRKDKINAYHLRSWTDDELDRRLSEAADYPYLFGRIPEIQSRTEYFGSEHEARLREAELKRQGVLITRVSLAYQKSPNPWVDILVAHRGMIRPFCDLFPHKAEKIVQRIGQYAGQVRLYYLTGTFPDELIKFFTD